MRLQQITLIFLNLIIGLSASGQIITDFSIDGNIVQSNAIQVCAGDSVTVVLSSAGGLPPYTYQLVNTSDPNIHFTPGNNYLGITGNSAVGGGSFAIRVTDGNGNQQTTSGSYSVVTQVSAGNAPTAIQYVCDNSPSVPLISFLSGSVTPNGTWTYDPFSANPQIVSGIFDPQSSPSGYYQYSVTNGVCPPITKFFQIQVNNAPTVQAGSDVQVAPLSSVGLSSNTTGGTPPYSYSWSPSAGLNNPNSANPTLTSANQTQLYQVTVTDAHGCQSTDDILVTLLSSNVNAYAPQTVFNLCPGETDTIEVIPSGGSSSNYSITWSPASAVSNSTSFTPTITATTSTQITGIVTDGFASDTVTIQVNFPPTVNFQFQPVQDLCITYGNFNISAVSPPPSQGGFFTGPGVDSLGNFSPAMAGLGTHVITYTYISPFGCVYSANQTIQVYPPHFVGFNPIAPICADAPPFSLNGGVTEPGLSGTYSGVGVSNGIFNPQNVGPGTYQITYSVNNAGCINTATTQLVVYPLPNVTISSFPSFCQGDSPYVLTEGSPAGGTYSGVGVYNGVFYPDSMNGQFFSLITYTYTDTNGCTRSANRAIQVFPKTTITAFNPPSPICQGANAFSMSGGSPSSGGSYSGPGISNNVFNPANAGVGIHTVYYTITNINGCVSVDSATIEVTPEPTVQLNLNFTDICIDQSAVSLSGGTPAGGSYSGFGVSNGQFSPAQSGVGPRVITYTYTDSNGCTASASQTIQVRPKPVPTMTPIGSFCISDAPLALNFGQPSGGTYSGLGVVNDTLYPNIAGTGTRLLTYTYTDSFGCTESTSAFYNIYGLPVVTAGNVADLCVSGAPITLSNGSPSGGTYSGPGVVNGIFDPAAAGIGTHTIKYVASNGNGCTDSTSFNIEVNAVPTVNFPAITDRCISSSPITLNFATPQGGVYQGNGISNGTFFPSNAGVGTHELIYIYTDASGCSNADTTYITINPVPNAALQPFSSMCLDAPPITLNQGSPIGGDYFGVGVVNGNQFDPSVAGLGTHQISYVVTNSTGCSDTAYQNIVVHPLPEIQWNIPSTVCIDNGVMSIAGASPSGGTYSGPGVVGSNFNPALAGVGTHTLSYTYTNAFQCTKDTTIQIQVTPLPQINISSFPTICERDSAFEITYASPAGGYWTGTGVTQNGTFFDPQQAGAGNHTLIYHYTDAFGCGSTQSVIVQVAPNPPIPLIIQSGSYLYCNWGFYEYQWSVDGQEIDTATGQTILATVSGNYVVVITNSFGCSSSSSDYFTYGVSLEEIENELILYPNPADRTIVIEGLRDGDFDLEISNTMGQIIKRVSVQNQSGKIQLETAEIASGAYYITITQESRVFQLPVIIRH